MWGSSFLADFFGGMWQGLGPGGQSVASGFAKAAPGVLGAGLGTASSIFDARARANALQRTNAIVDQQTGLLNATTQQQYDEQQAAIAQMKAQAQASQQAFAQQAFQAQFGVSQAAGITNPSAGQLAPYPKGDPSTPMTGRSTLTGA